MRVAFYVRVSTERQQQAQTIEQQVSRLRDYLASQPDWVVQEEQIFRDDGYSGAKLDRPGLDALRTAATQAAFDLVLMTAPDRLARNYVHQMVVLEELERRGVRVQFMDRPLSNDPHEQLVVQIRGAVAEYERTLIADRMRRGRLVKLQSGRLLPWTRAPYGYRLHPERPRDPALVGVDEDEAAVVQELFASYADGAATLYELAQRLTRRGLPSPTGQGHWNRSSVRGILTNPAYTGLAAGSRSRMVPARTRHSPLLPVGRGQSQRPRPPQEWVSVLVPALVPAEQFAQVQQRLRTNQQGAMRNTTQEYLLRSLVSCGVCRLNCQGRQRSQHGGRYRYYVCRGKLGAVASSREERCSARFIPAGQLEELVWADLCTVLQQPELVTAAVERAQSGAWLPEELQRRQQTLRGVRQSLERQQARLLDAYLAGALELPVFQHKDRELRQRQDDLRGQEREVAAQGQRLVELSAIAQSLIAICARLQVGLERASFAQRRQLVELLIDRVVVTDSAVEIRYVIPTTEASTHTRFCHLRTDYFQGPAPRVGLQDGGRTQTQVGTEEDVQLPPAPRVPHQEHLDRLAGQGGVPEGRAATDLGLHALPIEGDHEALPVPAGRGQSLGGGQALAPAAGTAFLAGLTLRRQVPQGSIRAQATDDLDVGRTVLQGGAAGISAVDGQGEAALRCPRGHGGGHLPQQFQLGALVSLGMGLVGGLLAASLGRTGGSVGSATPLATGKQAHPDGQGEAPQRPHGQGHPEGQGYPDVAEAEEGALDGREQRVMVY